MNEKDSDEFRCCMLEVIEQQQSSLIGMSSEDIIKIEHDSSSDIPYVIRVLRRILTLQQR